jgi:hypothetical protein
LQKGAAVDLIQSGLSSLFDDYADLVLPDFIIARDSMEWDFNGYRSGRVLKQRLMEVLEARDALKRGPMT